MFTLTAGFFWSHAASSPGTPAGKPAAPTDPLCEVLAAHRGGSGAAARQLVEQLYPTVIRIIRTHLPARVDEEDLAQEVFLKMFQKLAQFRGDRPLSHWVSRIATNTCLDALRRQKCRPELRFADLTEAEQAFLENSSTEAWEEPALSDETHHEGTAMVDKMIEKLKPDHQVVVRLMELEQKSVKEICTLTGWSASKVKVTALRARRHLADLVSKLRDSLS